MCVCVLRVWDVVFSIGPNVFACRTFAFMDRRDSSVPSQRKLNDIEKRDRKKMHFIQIWKRCSILACKWINNIVSTHTETTTASREEKCTWTSNHYAIAYIFWYCRLSLSFSISYIVVVALFLCLSIASVPNSFVHNVDRMSDSKQRNRMHSIPQPLPCIQGICYWVWFWSRSHRTADASKELNTT